MIRKFLIICIGLLAVASTAQAAMIQSMSVTNIGTTFGGGIGSALTMSGPSGINVEYTPEIVYTYGNAQFSLDTTLASDTSSGGIARGNFTGGSFMYKKSDGSILLSGDIDYFNLTEIYDNSGLFWGEGHFTVTGGTLQPDFLPQGDMVNISFSVKPKTISDFSSSFTGSSNMTVLPVPEPATIALMTIGTLAFLKGKNSK